MTCSPRGALHYCPRRLADGCRAAPVGPPHHRKPWRTDPGRQDDTLLPYADRTGRSRAAQPLTGQTRPAIACAPMHSTSTATPPAYRDDRETPLIHGPGWRILYDI